MATIDQNDNSLEEFFQSLKALDLGPADKFEDRCSSYTPDNAAIVQDELASRYLTQSNILPWSILDLTQTLPDVNFTSGQSDPTRKIKEDYDYVEFVEVPEPINRVSYRFQRKGIKGEIFGYKEEVNFAEVVNANAANSLLLTRKITHRSNALKGSTSQLPFTPGGLTMNAVSTQSDGSVMHTATKLLHRDAQGLFDIPQGLERGIIPQEVSAKPDDHIAEFNELEYINNEMENMQEIEDIQAKNESKLLNSQINLLISDSTKNSEQDSSDIDFLLPVGIEFSRTLRHDSNPIRKKKWAHIVDLSHTIDNFHELIPNPARTWPFELDGFQKEAIYHMEQGDSVFVAAHTSAGKTVVAEYAIAMSKRNMTKTIYTSPIKALSNQKFRDFKEDFTDVDVGLITGDVQINSEANCLIMTTEILRSMLYRGADLIRDVEFVIFDEVHYVNDQDRGVVWEEVIIMLPHHVKFILLSATVPNTYEFATWIGRTKQKNIYVISTAKRPVPLEINIWAKDTLIPVIDQDRKFSLKAFKKHADLLTGVASSKTIPRRGAAGAIDKNSSGTRGGKTTNRGNKTITHGSRGVGAKGSNRSSFFRRDGPNKQTWPKLVNYLKARELLPVVIFVFSKKRCEEYADFLESTDFSTAKEKSQVYMFIEKSISRLKKEDRDLPQIMKIRSLLERGIAIHHGGLLPIVKELIEMLFAKGFVKVLFATETFAMGLNLPTRTVVFSEIEKHDGNSLRTLNPGEFTQMAGRAGRRGKDPIGTVIIMTYNNPIDELPFKEVTLGVPTRLKSQFRLTYNMILNLLRIEALRVEEMIKYSFSENSKQNLLPKHEKKVKILQEVLEKEPNVECSICNQDIDTAVEFKLKFGKCTQDILKEANNNRVLVRMLKVGRLVGYRDNDGNMKLGFIFSVNLANSGCTVLSFSSPCTLKDGKVNSLPFFNYPNYANKFFQPFNVSEPLLENILLEDIELIAHYYFVTPLANIINGDPEAKEAFYKKTLKLTAKAHTLRELNIEKYINLKIQQYLMEQRKTVHDFLNLKCLECDNFPEHFGQRYRKYGIEQQIKDTYHLMSDQNLNLLPDYEQRLAVLRECGFIASDNTVLLKGRVACEINSGYELVLTELILDNFLGDFESEEIVALLSIFVYEGRTRQDEQLVTTPRLAKGIKRIEEIYTRLLETYEMYQVPLTKEEAEFLERNRAALINVVYEWARGLPFRSIMEISVEAEGTIVRTITRLDEVCREVKIAASIIGDSSLNLKMCQAQELIKRDIVFAASLYL
ncbi:SKI complex RNA helicase subunit SKI2 Ecym_3257 [Eremothecium cymbalariae DBVPG|uniref:Antiviral helicase n=1 Tax=Eremothecium cymbalariae (strain CBS 270.75 / DBVPG 7215 / KCTC 17166 / NRRL Y-17582) TaxID=931890 RepID=G8JRI1_ERECY|nr:Hypothetical protein Ecym_3257 [Eremothecium cymbalariae DBVPG\